MLRGLVHGLSRICGALAACSLAIIAIGTLVQIIARQFAIPIETTELSGFFLAASTFLGLAYTFVNGGHVRIGLVSQFTAGPVKRSLELWACAVAALIVGYAAWHMTAFMLETYRFGDLSPGMIAAPLWIPQSAVAFGLFVLLLAIIEQATLVWAGREAGYETNADQTAE